MMLCLSVFAAESVEPVAGAFTASAQKDSLTPYTQASEVPQTALELWKDYDPRQEDLVVKIHYEWKQDGVVARLISFKVGTFKGSDARIAAYYFFPENGKKIPPLSGAMAAHIKPSAAAAIILPPRASPPWKSIG